MDDENQSLFPKESSLDLSIYKSEDQVCQKLHLCKYLSELPEINEDGIESPEPIVGSENPKK